VRREAGRGAVDRRPSRLNPTRLAFPPIRDVQGATVPEPRPEFATARAHSPRECEKRAHTLCATRGDASTLLIVLGPALRGWRPVVDRSADGPERPLRPFDDGIAASRNGNESRPSREYDQEAAPGSSATGCRAGPEL
jgi:hypothetical protein